MTRSYRAMASAALIAAVIGLAACSAPGSDPGKSDSNADKGAVIRYQLSKEPTSFNPFAAATGVDGEISGLQFRALLKGDKDGYVPYLATEWAVNDDATVYTFTLRDAKWSDGEPFTTDDVIFSYEGYLNPATKSPYAGGLGGVQGAEEFTAGTADTVSGITAVDDHTIQITLTAPDAGFLSSLTPLYIVPKHVYEGISPDQYAGNEAFREPKVGMGPYVFKRWVTDDEIEFDVNKQSFEDPKLSKVYAQVLTDDVARAQLETGEIDIAHLSAADVDSIKDKGDINVYEQTGNAATALWTALDTPKLADPRVRQAILYAIDRDAIVKSVLAGHGVVPQTMMFAPAWTIPDDLIQYNYDPDKARELLAEAGWDAKTQVNLEITPGDTEMDTVDDIIQGQLTQVGINAKVVPMQSAALNKAIDDRKFDLLISPMGMDITEPASLDLRFLCAGIGGLNFQSYCNHDLDPILEAADSTSDMAKRTELYFQAQKIINVDMPAIPLYVASNWWGTTKRVKGYDPDKSPGLGGLTVAQNWSVTQ